MIRTTQLIFAFILLPLFGRAQILSSQILDEKTTEPIPYAHVYLKGTQIGTYSNSEGRFELTTITQISEEDSLVISSIGYEKTILSFQDIKETVYLKQSLLLLDEETVSSKK